MRWLMMVAAVLVGISAGITRAADADQPFIAESPEQIRPLLIGADIPDVTLITPDGQSVVLREALAKQPTILIYYRGGW